MSEFVNTPHRGGSQTSPEDRRGFALPTVLMLMVVLSTITVFLLSSSSDQQRVGRAMRESARSFYAADAGLNAVLAEWDSLSYDTLASNPGDSADLGWTTLENGARYRAVFVRVDGGTAGDPMYSVRVVGQGAGSFGGSTTMFRALYGGGGVHPDSVCCGAAVTGGGASGADVELDSMGVGGVTVSGVDHLPSSDWSDRCTDPLVDAPGITWSDTTLIDQEGSSSVDGTPPIVEDASITSADLFDWGGLDYDGLAAMADIVLADGADPDLNQLGPLEAPPGTCKTLGVGSEYNWGEPEDKNDPCFNYFPIIHVTGDLRMGDGPGYGQGILLVDGELRIEGQFEFYGIIMTGAKDPERTRFEDNVIIHGGMIVNEELRMEDASTLQYSACAIKTVLEAAGISGAIKPLSERSWRQAMN